MEGNAPPPPPPATVSKVLNDDDLLAEILLRVGFPTTLVSAAAVCRRFLHRASDGKFLRRFREFHPPRLLGFHVVEVDWSAPTVPRFVPLPPHHPELAAVVRRASSCLRAYQSDDIASIRIIDCRSGSVLIEHREDGSGSTKGVLSMLCPERGMVAVPPRPQPQCKDHNYYAHSEILSKEEGDGVSYVYVSIEVTTERKYMVHVYVLQHGAWCCTHSLAIHQLPRLLLEPESVLVDSKIYIAAARSKIIVLDLSSSRFSTIQLPQGVKHGERSTRLSRANDAAGIYLIHVKELQLRIWLHNNVDGWLLVDTICLRGMLASLGMLGCDASLRIRQVEDNAVFVFLEMGRCALHLDIKCRTLHKVYEVAKETRYLGDIHPFMMIWPPTFPALKDDPASLDFDGLNCQSRPRKTRNPFFPLCTFLPRSPSCPAPKPTETKLESVPLPPPPPVVSKVLNDDDLLDEILLRVGFPTTLVRAAAVCRRFLHHASDGKFLRRFRKLHPPRLLGFHVVEVDWSAPTVPRFVPLPPHHPELAAVVRRASSCLRAYQSDDIASIRILDCRNGSVLIEHREDGSGSTTGVLSLLCPERGMVAMPRRPQRQDHNYYAYWAILSREEGAGGLSYLYVLIEVTPETKYTVQVFVLQHGVWCCTHSLAVDQLPLLLHEPKSIINENKIYIAAAQRELIVLDLATSSLATIQLPHGVEHGEKSTRLSRADDATSVYLIHVKELQLCIWLHKGDGWLLVDTICLREMLASLGMLGCDASLRIKQVEDNAEFVFLEMDRCALHLDIKCRTLHKIYEVAKETRYLGDIHPFMMIWPPTFPALKDDPGREAPVLCSEED